MSKFQPFSTIKKCRIHTPRIPEADESTNKVAVREARGNKPNKVRASSLVGFILIMLVNIVTKEGTPRAC